MVFPYFPFHDGRNVPATAISDGSGGELQRRPYQEGNMAFPAVSAVDKCLCPSYSLWRDTDSRQRNGARYLSLFAFIGGFSAASSMIIVETLALSTMVMNSIIMPVFINFHDAPRFPTVILNMKRLVIMVIVYIGYWFTTSVGGLYSLVDM